MDSQRHRSLTSPPRATLASRAPVVGSAALAVPAAVLIALTAAALIPAQWATLLVIAPTLEELVFRAGLQETLLRRFGGRHAAGALAANVVTGLAFAAAHVALHAGVLAALTLLPALLIGRVYQRRRRLAPCIALHALFNAIWLLRAGIPA